MEEILKQTIGLLNDILKPCNTSLNSVKLSDGASAENIEETMKSLTEAQGERDKAIKDLSACQAEKGELETKIASMSNPSGRIDPSNASVPISLDGINGTATDIDTLLSFLDKTTISGEIKGKLKKVKEVLNTKITIVPKVKNP